MFRYPITLTPDIQARFKTRSTLKKSLPGILETLEALGLTRREGKDKGEGWRGV